MSRKTLDSFSKSIICEMYNAKLYTQQELADEYGVSTRTIGRILDEGQITRPKSWYTAQTMKFMEIIDKHKIQNPLELDRLVTNAIEKRLVTTNDVLAHMNTLTTDQLLSLIMKTIKVRWMGSKSTEPLPPAITMNKDIVDERLAG